MPMDINDLIRQGARQLDVRKYLREYIRAEKKRPKNVGLLIDGPNIIRKEFSIDLADVRKRAEKYGNLKTAKVFLNQYAKEKLIEAVANQGFEPVMSISEDVDVDMAVEAMDMIRDAWLDIIILVTRDADFLPVFRRAKEKNKTIMVFGPKGGIAAALKNAADKVEFLSTRRL